MGKSLIYSLIFHSVMILLTVLTLPFMIRQPIDLPPIVSVELIQISDKTNIPFAPKARKIIEETKKKEERVVSEQAPPAAKAKEKPDRIPLPDDKKEKKQIVKKKQNPEEIEPQIRQSSEFEKKEIVDTNQIAALIDKAKEIEAVKEKQFVSIDELAIRAGINDQNMRFLARAGALKSLSGNRHQAHWDVAGINRPFMLTKTSSNTIKDASLRKKTVVRPEPSPEKNLISDYRYTGFTLGPHPMYLIKNNGDWSKYTTAEKLVDSRSGQFIRVAGLVTGRQRPSTASGIIFMTIEDETGNINVVIWTGVLEKFRSAVLQGQLLKIKGVVEREGAVIHVVAGHIEDASHLFTNMTKSNLDLKSRDFH